MEESFAEASVVGRVTDLDGRADGRDEPAEADEVVEELGIGKPFCAQ